MAKIETQEQLLTALAFKGEPLAFFRLFETLLKETFLNLRLSGLNRLEATSALCDHCAGMYHRFLNGTPSGLLSEWYHRIAPPAGASKSSHEDSLIENAEALRDWETAENLVLTTLLREYGNLRRGKSKGSTHRVSGTTGPGQSPRRNGLRWLMAVIVVIVLGAVTFQLVLLKTSNRIVINISGRRIVVMPVLFGRKRDTYPNLTPSVVAADSSANDTTNAATSEPVLQKTPIMPRSATAKTAAIPNPNPRPLSPPAAKEIPQPIAAQKVVAPVAKQTLTSRDLPPQPSPSAPQTPRQVPVATAVSDSSSPKTSLVSSPPQTIGKTGMADSPGIQKTLPSHTVALDSGSLDTLDPAGELPTPRETTPAATVPLKDSIAHADDL